MENWIKYLDAKFSEYEQFNCHKNKNSFYPSRTYKIGGICIDFYFDGITKLNKIEFGKYWLIDNEVYFSSVKAVYDNLGDNFVSFLQTSFDGESGTRYELNFTLENTKKLDTFLKLPIEIGWIEKLYKYKKGAYKIEIECMSNIFQSSNCKIILLDFVEQDLPLPGDKLSRKVNAFLIDKFAPKKKIEVEIVEVKPMKTIKSTHC